jgi:hypothetical protein
MAEPEQAVKRISRPVTNGQKWFFPLFAAFFLFSIFSCVTRPALITVDIAASSGGLDWLPLYGGDGLPVEGLALLAARSAAPQLEFWAIRADLNSPRIRIVVGPAAAGGQTGTVPSIKVSSFVRDYGCIAAVNANPFDSSSSIEGEARGVAGLAISDGSLISPPHPRYGALVFFADGKTAILNQRDTLRERVVLNAAGGFYQILENGEPAARALTERGGVRHPRSAAGVSADGGILFLLVIDGRRSGSAGATEEETALILKTLGASDGLCFDGGGSSALAVKTAALRPAGADRPDGVTVLNKPVHGGIPGTERAVAVCLGIAVGEP